MSPLPVMIHIPDERPQSWNKSYAGQHWKDRGAEAKRVHYLVASFCPPDSVFEVPVHILMRVSFNKRPLDVDNIAVKYYIDGLKGRVISDDTLNQVQSVTVEAVRGDKAYVEIVIAPRRIW